MVKISLKSFHIPGSTTQLEPYPMKIHFTRKPRSLSNFLNEYALAVTQILYVRAYLYTLLACTNLISPQEAMKRWPGWEVSLYLDRLPRSLRRVRGGLNERFDRSVLTVSFTLTLAPSILDRENDRGRLVLRQFAIASKLDNDCKNYCFVRE